MAYVRCPECQLMLFRAPGDSPQACPRCAVHMVDLPMEASVASGNSYGRQVVARSQHLRDLARRASELAEAERRIADQPVERTGARAA